MAACASCKQPLPRGSLSCPSCGRRCLPDGHPPPSSSAPPPVGDGPLELDLGLAPPPRGAFPAAAASARSGDAVPDFAPAGRPPGAARAAGLASSRPPPPPPGGLGGGERFDAAESEDDDGPGIALEVDAAPIPPRGRAGHSSSPPRAGSSRPAPPDERAPAATLEARSGEPLFVDPVVIQALGDYGPPPGSLWEAPAYALRVLARRRALRAALPAAERAALDAEKALEEAMVIMMDEARAPLESRAEAAALLSPSREIEQLAGQRRRAIDDYERSRREGQDALDHELHAIERSLPDDKAALEVAKRSAAAAFDRLKQAATDTPAARPARAALDQARREMAALEQRVAAREARRGEIRRARRQIDDEHPARLAALTDAHAITELERQKAALSLASQLLAGEGRELGLDVRGALGAAEDARKSARVRLEAHRRALGAFDKTPVVRALLLVIGAAFALLLFLAVGIYRMMLKQFLNGTALAVGSRAPSLRVSTATPARRRESIRRVKPVQRLLSLSPGATPCPHDGSSRWSSPPSSVAAAAAPPPPRRRAASPTPSPSAAPGRCAGQA